MSPQRKSGDPAKQAAAAQTVKQQREQKRNEKLAEYQRQIARRRRRGLMWWVVGGVAAVAVAGVVVASIVFQPPAPVSYDAGTGPGVEIDGVETFQNDTTHVEGTVDYPQNPPAGGPHNQYWLNCGEYSEPQQNEYAVHSLEHGAVWVTYDPERVSGEDLETLRSHMPADYYLLSPYEGLDSPLALSAWNAQLTLDSVDDERIPQFFEEYWRSDQVPEPTAVCHGAIDGEGRV
ncbi:DUF3105 domain-containing protein [Microbacterium sp. LRZ72]|uniref:DUF3105 domain-containing protein n=1 Tax=Microbacterium sp. LRZ72 TaxID=2942481 RepID=UPI0029BC3153|nr:DUF3105 domain-containing protein [Microbacterium sp. LRZ72]MDX2376835.1 DUF3105 domain-containing protein [Microbacterium sp. LRZ72]